MAHAILSPSHAHTWAQCVAAPFWEKGMPNEESPYAAEGTQAHALAELTLRSAIDDEDVGILPEVSKEMEENVRMYTDFVSNLIKEHDGCFYDFEYSVELEHVTGEEKACGTIDSIVCTDDHLWITDLKYGAGVPVEAKENPQLLIYAAAALHQLEKMYDEVKTVTLTIVQPRCGGINSWDIDVESLEAFRRTVYVRSRIAWAIYDEQAAPTDSNYYCEESVCRWCRGKSKCPKFTETTQKALVADYEEIDNAPAELKTIRVPDDPEKLAKAYALMPIVKQWCDMVQESMAARLGQGEQIPGYKLVAGRKGARAWDNAENVEKMMKAMRMKREDMYDFKLISPTKFEAALKSNPKLLGKGQVQKLRECITQSEGKPAVVVDSDPRPAIQTASSSDYEALPD